MKSISVITSGRLRDTLNPGTSRFGAAVPRLGAGVLVPWHSVWGASLGPLRERGHLAGCRECRSASVPPCSFRSGARWWGWPGLRPRRHDRQSEMSARRAIGMAAEKMTDGDAENVPAQDPPGAGPVDTCEQRYPDYLMDFPPDLSPEQVQHWQRFFNLREDILLDYGYQTARAYWTDLQDIFEWAIARDKDVLTLTNRDLRQYCALLRRRKYSEATIRRRMVAWRKMEEKMKEG